MDRLDEVNLKLQRVRGWLNSCGREAVLVTSQANFAWLTGGGNNYVSTGNIAGEASLLVTSDGSYLLSNNIERRRLLEEEVAGLPFEPLTWYWYEGDGAKEHLGRLCDPSKSVSDIRFLDLPLASEGFSALRYDMLPPEVDRYRRLGQEAAQAVEKVCRDASSGDAELDVAASLAFECQKLGILPLVNLVAADERIARYRHPLPTKNPIQRTLMVVLSGRRQGLHISLTRLISLGPLDPDLLARHRAVTRVDARFILESRAGNTLGAVVSRAAEQYAIEGFPQEWKLHHQGGLTGYADREILGTGDSGHRLRHHQVLAWNPSITGTKSEDTVLVTETGPEVLTRTGDWPEVEVELPGGSIGRPSIKT